MYVYVTKYDIFARKNKCHSTYFMFYHKYYNGFIYDPFYGLEFIFYYHQKYVIFITLRI